MTLPTCPLHPETLHQTIGSLHAKVDILLERGASHDERITALEKRQWIGAGVAGAIVLYFSGLPGKLEALAKMFG